MSEKHPKTMYVTDLDEVHRWIAIINREVFDGQLPPFKSVSVKSIHEAWAYTVGTVDPIDGENVCDLVLARSMKSLKHLVKVLCHESIHHWQWTELGNMDHGKTFRMWRPKLRKLGVPLYQGAGN